MPSGLGIYFGIKAVSIVETKNKKLANTIKIPFETIPEAELEEKVPEEIKLTTLLKEKLNEARIEAKEINITLSGKDLIIRTFDMPLFILKDELQNNAVNFEAKKYIPFKTEELISDFQLKIDKKNKKNLVLFFSSKKEILDKYISVIEQLGLEIINIEYSAFSLLRLLDLAGVRKKGVLAVIDIDIEEETNFTVLEDGFPLFSRDINLATGLEEVVQETLKDSLFWERLKNEIRISLDYYRRKFPTKQINRLMVITNQIYNKNDMDTLGSELGLAIEFIDIFKYITKETQLSMGYIKAYSASLVNNITTPLRLNLLATRKKIMKTKVLEAELEIMHPSLPIRIDYRFVLAGLFIMSLSFIWTLSQKLPLEKQLKEILSRRLKLVSLSAPKTYEELQKIYSDYKNKLSELDNVVKSQVYLTEELNIIPSILPEGTWLLGLSFRQSQEGMELILNGQAYFDDPDKEFKTVNELSSNLKSSPIFSQTFKNIDVTSLDRQRTQDWEVTNFIISCGTKKYETRIKKRTID